MVWTRLNSMAVAVFYQSGLTAPRLLPVVPNGFQIVGQLRQRAEIGLALPFSDHVDVAQRIQADSPEHEGGRVAEVAGDITVSGFMQGDREDDRQSVDRDGLDEIEFHGRSPYFIRAASPPRASYQSCQTGFRSSGSCGS